MAASTSEIGDEQKRVALVIGNASYLAGPPLANPVTDALAIVQSLKRLGFDPVEQYLNLDKAGHDKALKQFASLSKGADMAVVYYAGHGMELDGENYLLPVDAELADVSALAFEATRLSDIMRAVEGADKFRFVILDACRDNPFRRMMQGIEGTRAMLSRGLAAPPDWSGNTLVAYAARHGTAAKDGRKGENSPFAAALLKHIETPNTDIRLIIGRIRDSVREATSSQQEPAFYGSMGGAEVQLKRVEDAPKPMLEPSNETELLKAIREELHWEKTQREHTIKSYQAFGAQWPQGRFAEEALRKIEEIREAEDYRAAKGIDGLKAFLAKWPRGVLFEKAGLKLEDLTSKELFETKVEPQMRLNGYDAAFDPASLRAFLTAYPKHSKAAEISKKLADTEKYQGDVLAGSFRRALAERYVKNWPQGSQLIEAQRLLDGGGDDRMWIEVQKDKSSRIVQTYLSEWPNGRHASEARTLLKQREGSEARWGFAALGFLLALGSAGVFVIYFILTTVLPDVYNNSGTWIDRLRTVAADAIRGKKDEPSPVYIQPSQPSPVNGKTLDELLKPHRSFDTKWPDLPATMTPSVPPASGGSLSLPSGTSTFNHQPFLRKFGEPDNSNGVNPFQFDGSPPAIPQTNQDQATPPIN